MSKTKQLKNIKWVVGTILTLMSLMAGLYYFNSPVAAQGQETCPDGGEWIKIDDIDEQSYTYEAPEGKVIIETCYKAGTEVVYETIDPPQTSVTVTSEVLNPVGSNYQDISHASFRLRDAATPTPTSTPTQTPTPTPTPTDEVTDRLTLISECLGEDELRWTVSNSNDFAIDFTWEASNGESGEGQVPANGNVSFNTSGEATVMTINYSLQEELELVVEAVVCTEEDPAPDQAAGGGGPSILPILLPLFIGISGLGLISGLVIKHNKKID